MAQHFNSAFFIACHCVLMVLLAGAAGSARAADAPALPKVLQIGGPQRPSQVPPPLRRGTFLSPQAVSALDISDNAHSIAVGTMAFRHDRNFFLLSAADGKVLWSRHVEPWATSQVAALSANANGPATAFAAAMAFSRHTEPHPFLSLFRGEKEKETAALPDSGWERGLLRYGGGDWRTGWTPSLLGDSFARGHAELFTVASHDDPSLRWTAAAPADAKPQRFPLPRPRPFRMTVSANGRVLALGLLVPDLSKLDEPTRQRLQPSPRGLITAIDTSTANVLWTAAPSSPSPGTPGEGRGEGSAEPAIATAPQPPEPADDYPDLAEPFNMKALANVPLRLAASVSVNGDGSRVAVTEYSGWLRVRRHRLIGYWSGHGQGISFCPRQQRGHLRIFDQAGKPLAQAQLPRDGLFNIHLNPTGDTAWCIPSSWFARGAAGHAWLPADGPDAHTLFIYDIPRQSWSTALRFPDAIADAALHPDSQRLLVSCWNGRAYLISRDGALLAETDLASPARLRWTPDGAFAIVGTESGEIFCLDRDARPRWKTPLPAAQAPRLNNPLNPVFPELPIYSVGRTGPEHAYVGDTWLIKTPQGGILIDTGGTSAIPLTLEKIRAAGLDPSDIRYLLLTHSHGDHANAAYLWRSRGIETVAPASAAFATSWVNSHWTGYGLAVPTPIDHPLPLRRPGDETDVTLCGLTVKAIFTPGHSIDSVIYCMDLSGNRVIFTGDIAFHDPQPGRPLGSNILHRCWADREKAATVIRVIEEKVLPLRPEFEFKGHATHRDPEAVWRNILDASRKALNQKESTDRN